MVEIGVQVNGKVRGAIEVAPDAEESVARERALLDPRVSEFIGAKTVKKVVYVKGKILNFIVG